MLEKRNACRVLDYMYLAHQNVIQKLLVLQLLWFNNYSILTNLEFPYRCKEEEI